MKWLHLDGGLIPLILGGSFAAACVVVTLHQLRNRPPFELRAVIKRFVGTWVVTLVAAIVFFLIFLIVALTGLLNLFGGAVDALSGGCVNC
jgi:hypothetical protein